MEHMRFLSITVIVYFGEEKGFDCKNNYGCGKSANFRLDKISKINCRMLVILVIIYLIRIGFEKGPIGPEGFQIVCVITMQLVVNSYQRLYLLY